MQERDTETDGERKREGREGDSGNGGQGSACAAAAAVLTEHFVLCGRPNGANKTFYAIRSQTKRDRGGKKREREDGESENKQQI